MSIQFPKWTPVAAQRAANLWWTNDSGRLGELCKQLTTDYRMEGVFIWLKDNALEKLRIDPRARKVDTETGEVINTQDQVYGNGDVWAYDHFMLIIYYASSEPEKPGNIPPGERKEYLEKVKNYAEKLKLLLLDTRFDNDPFDYATLHFDNQLESRLKDDLKLSLQSDHPDARKVTYLFSEGETYRAPSDYPLFSFTQQLDEVIKWTRKDSGYGRDEQDKTSVKQHGAKGMKGRFLVNLKKFLDYLEIDMPYKFIAEIANVVLDLGKTEIPELDEQSVRRHLERTDT